MQIWGEEGAHITITNGKDLALYDYYLNKFTRSIFIHTSVFLGGNEVSRVKECRLRRQAD